MYKISREDYSAMTQDDFDSILESILSDMTGLQLFSEITEIQSDVMKYFNNQVLDKWEESQYEDDTHPIDDDIAKYT